MTSKFDDQALQQKINAELDSANAQLSDSVMSDIAMARQRALSQAARAGEKSPANLGLSRWFENRTLQVAVPAAFAVAAVMLVSYQSNEVVPMLPAEFLTADVPMEDLSLLEDLEFASWLAQQEQEVSI